MMQMGTLSRNSWSVISSVLSRSHVPTTSVSTSSDTWTCPLKGPHLFTSPCPLYPVFRQAHLLSAEFGKHLLEVEDLLQKHKLMEADIAIQGDKVKAITAATLQFTEGKGEPQGISSVEPHALAWALAWHPTLDESLEFCFFHQVMVHEA